LSGHGLSGIIVSYFSFSSEVDFYILITLVRPWANFFWVFIKLRRFDRSNYLSDYDKIWTE